MSTASADPLSASYHDYRQSGSASAFQALVRQSYPLVWHTARRVLGGDAALAEDAAQLVYTSFAQQARA